MTHSIDDRGPAPACPTPFNLAGYVLDAGLAMPEKPALVRVGAEGADLTHGALRQAVLGLAAHLRDRGLAPGGRVLIRLGNDPAFPIAFLAAAAADLVPVVVSSLLTAPELAQAAAHVHPVLAIADPALPLCDLPCPVLPVDALAPAMAAAPAEPVAGNPDRPGYIVFTSGTTSAKPRAVLHAHRAVWARRMMWRDWYGLGRGDRMLHAGAFNWTFTLGTGLLDPWAAGATALVPAPGLPPEALPPFVGASDATIFAAAPGIYRRMLDRGAAFDAPALRHGLSAGEKLSDGLRARWRDATGTALHEAFGMSECSTFVSGGPAAPAPAGTLGRAQDGRNVALVDESGRPVPRGAPGQIAVSAADPGLMLGYLGADRALDLPLTRGRFLSGDMASMDGDGNLTYLGRNDDLLNVGGVRVSPLEVEATLSAHPAIIDCAVAEIRVKKDVSVIAAFCISDEPLDEDKLKVHMSGRLARYKQPRLYVRVDALPRNANGKLKRRALRDAWNGADD